MPSGSDIISTLGRQASAPAMSMLGFGGMAGGAGNPFGSRVGAIPNVTGPNLGDVYPNLSGTNAALSSALTSELTGALSPSTLANIQNSAAEFGITSGMPGSGLVQYRTPRDIGLATESLIHQGIGDYSSAIPSVASTQTVNPNTRAELNTQINAQNALSAAAPDPAAAANYAENLYEKHLGQSQSYAQQIFDKYLNSLKSPVAHGPQVPWWQQGQAGSYYTPPIGDTALGGSFTRGGSLMGVI